MKLNQTFSSAPYTTIYYFATIEYFLIILVFSPMTKIF